MKKKQTQWTEVKGVETDPTQERLHWKERDLSIKRDSVPKAAWAGGVIAGRGSVGGKRLRGDILELDSG